MTDYGFGVLLVPLSEIPPHQMLFWRNQPEVYDWCRQYEPLETWTHQEWLERLSRRPDVKMYGISWTADDGVALNVGVCGLTSIDWVNRRAEFSLYVGPEYHGHGIGKKALKTLLAHGFLALNLNLIWGETFEGNRAAKVFEELGFQKEGTRRQFYYRKGAYLDAHLYSILKDEFRLKWLIF